MADFVIGIENSLCLLIVGIAGSRLMGGDYPSLVVWIRRTTTNVRVLRSFLMRVNMIVTR